MFLSYEQYFYFYRKSKNASIKLEYLRHTLPHGAFHDAVLMCTHHTGIFAPCFFLKTCGAGSFTGAAIPRSSLSNARNSTSSFWRRRICWSTHSVDKSMNSIDFVCSERLSNHLLKCDRQANCDDSVTVPNEFK